MQNLNFTGTQINYYFVCHRKLWLFSKDIRFEDENEYVQLGRLIDDIHQVKYYILTLKRMGVKNITGEIDYPKLKKRETVSLMPEDEKEFKIYV